MPPFIEPKVAGQSAGDDELLLDKPAYILFTSGSTGKSELTAGVVSHSAVAARFDWMLQVSAIVAVDEATLPALKVLMAICYPTCRRTLSRSCSPFVA